MTKLKKVKTELRKRKLLSEYNKKFKHKDMRFLFSYVALTFDDSIKVSALVKEEVKLLKADKEKDMFVASYLVLKELTDKKIDWKSFGKFIWFIFQTSTYWKDQRKKIENEFKKDNLVITNQTKRIYYNKWLESLPADIEDQNNKVIQIMKRVF